MDRETVEEIKRQFDLFAAQIRADVRALADTLDSFRAETALRFYEVDRRFDGISSKFEEVNHEFEKTRAPIRLS